MLYTDPYNARQLFDAFDISNGYKRVKKLDEILTKINRTNPIFYYDLNTRYDYSVMHYAAEIGDLEVVEFISDKLYEKNPAYTTTDDFSGLTPLHLAVLSGQYEIVQFIISTLKKDERNPGTDKGETPAHYAAQNGMIDILDLLLPDLENKNPETDKGLTLLHYAANHNIPLTLEDQQIGVPTIKYLTKFVKDSNPPDNSGLTPMHYAVLNNKRLIVQHYLNTLPFGKKNPMEDNDQKFTPLHYAAAEGHLDLVQIISDELDDKNPKAGHDITPLHVAVNLNSGNADVSIQRTGRYGGRKVFGKLDIVKFIVEALNRSERNTPADDFFDKNTPLHILVNYVDSDPQLLPILSYLVSKVPIVNPTNSKGLTPEDIAFQRGHLEATNLLKLVSKLPNNRFEIIDAVIEGDLQKLKSELAKSDETNPDITVMYFGDLKTKYNLDDDPEYLKLLYLPATVIHLAANEGKLEIVEYLSNQLERERKEINPSLPIYDSSGSGPYELSGFTPLHFAVEKDHTSVVEFILSKLKSESKNPFSITEGGNNFGITPAHIAAINENSAMTQLLLSGSENENPTCDTNEFILPTDYCNGKSILHIAADKGMLELIEYLAESMSKDTKWYINPPDSSYLKRTPLHYAAQNRHDDILKFIIPRVCNSWMCDADPYNPQSPKYVYAYPTDLFENAPRDLNRKGIESCDPPESIPQDCNSTNPISTGDKEITGSRTFISNLNKSFVSLFQKTTLLH